MIPKNPAHDGVAPAVRAAADSLDVFDFTARISWPAISRCFWRNTTWRSLVPGGTFLLNTPYAKDEIWSKLPTPVQESLIAKKAKFYVIDATKVARDSGMGGRINTIMQVCFFALSGVLPRTRPSRPSSIPSRKPTARKARKSWQMNLKAVDNTLAHLHEVPVANRKMNGSGGLLPPISPQRPGVCEATCWASSPPAKATNCP
jgi:hypothetical protein